MIYGTIPGVATPVARMVMGVDNQDDLAKAAPLFDDYIERGGNCFDTARIYMRGGCETLFGEYLAKSDVRDRIVLIGKGAHTPNCTPEAARSQLEQSLEALRTDRVEIYFLHRDNPQVPVGEFVDVLDAFFERGGTAFDTAHKYGDGLCDDALGRWMETRGVRDRCVVIGKGAHTPHCDPVSLTRQLHESLERLRTDHLDVYLLHRDDLDVPVGEFVDVLDEHHRAGRVHAVGGSNWTAARIDAANAYARANRRVEMTVVSNQLSLARMISPTFEGTVGANEPDFLAWLVERGHTLVAWSSQAAGFFAGLGPDGPLAHAWFDDANLERRRRVESLAAELGQPATTVALAWVLGQPYAVLPVIGPRRLPELRTSLDALALALTPAQLAWLDLAE